MRISLRLLLVMGVSFQGFLAMAQDSNPVPANSAPAAAPATPANGNGAVVPPTVQGVPVVIPTVPVTAPAPATPPLEAVMPASSLPSEKGDASETVPVITIDEAPLPDAIKHLARQANVNFQFDQKVLVGVPGPDGKPLPPPIISIRWENITPMQALQALLDNYSLQLISDSRTKVARITYKDSKQEDPLISKVFSLNYSQATNLLVVLTNTLSARSKVLPDSRTGQLVIVTTEKELPGIEALLNRLDTPSRQVLIEARILETSKNPRSIRGVDWSGTLNSQNVTVGNGVTSGITTTTSPGTPTSTTLPGGSVITTTPASSTATTLTTAVGNGGLSMDTARGFHPSTAFLNADGVRAVLSMLNSDSDTESLATPRAITMDGVATELSVVRNIPVFEEQQGASTAGSQSPVTVKPNYELKVRDTVLNEVGIKLLVTPRIMGITNVLLDLRPEVSAVEALPEVKRLGNRVNEAPIFSRRKITTQATVPSGNTLVLGGLRNDFNSKSSTKVPFLGDIPGLGILFRHETKSRSRQNLMVFVTPTIVEGGDFQPTTSTFLQTKPVEKLADEDPKPEKKKKKDWTAPADKQ